MESRNLEIKIIRANGLKNVNLMSKMDVYAVVSISGNPRGKLKQKTPVARDGGTDPLWNYSMKFTIDEAAAQNNRLTLKIKLVSERSLGDRKIGKVIVPIKQLYDQSVKGNDDEKSSRSLTYSVRTASGKEKGSVEFSYQFGETYTVQAPPHHAAKMGEPVMAYPNAYPGSSSAYPQPAPATAYPYPPPGGYPPPPQAGYGYPPAPQPGYAYGGYPPPQPGYGYPPVQQPQKPKRGGMGGMGLGLGAGLLGGLLVGEMISDVGEMDSGFGDGFDF